MEVWSGSSLSDPAGSSALVAAVNWLQGTLLGTVATTVAIVAIASVGFMMLSGRVNVRRGATVIVGCFILFGAPSIAAGIRSAGAYGEGEYPPVNSAVRQPAPSPMPVYVPPPAPKPDRDPYAGASVPFG
jgi:type IV secretory pathway VirB2 component (pilin)